MKNIKVKSRGKSHTTIDLGSLDKLASTTFAAPGGGEMTGKVFIKDLLNASGVEISLSTLPSGGEIPFFHSHRQNEEIYIILKGEGDFQVDDDSFPISEGSIVRVGTGSKSTLRNTSKGAMFYIVVQSKEGSLEQYSLGDADIVAGEPNWK